MSSDAESQKLSLDPEQSRDGLVYRYLLALTDLDVNQRSELPNETSIAKQWGMAGNRIFVRRVLRWVLYEEYYRDNPKASRSKALPGLTLSKLVSILASLQAYRRDKQKAATSDRPIQLLTRQEILGALQLFSQLSYEELTQLDLEPRQGDVLLRQLVEQASDPALKYSYMQTFELYNFFLSQLGKRATTSLKDVILQAEEEVDAEDSHIYKMVEVHTRLYFSELKPKEKQDLDLDIARKVHREINRINLQAGIEQVDIVETFPVVNERLFKYLRAEFVQRLVHSVIDNEVITDEFPIHLKYIEVKRIKPLPLYLRKSAEQSFALNPDLLQSPEEHEVKSASALARQVAYRVRVHFYIKLPTDYQVQFKTLTTTSEIDGQRRLEFYEEVVGIGCPTSHITTVINRVIFWDIPILNDYMPIASGTHCNDEIMGGTPNSPVWSHCVARLYKADDIKQAIARDKERDSIAVDVETARADFCGFDLIETSAKAALLARLKLVKQVLSKRPDVSASDYIRQLCYRIEETTALKRGRRCLSNYPFSLKAM